MALVRSAALAALLSASATTAFVRVLPSPPPRSVVYSAVAEEPPVVAAVAAAAAAAPAEAPRPGADENRRFRTDASVDMWGGFQAAGEASALENFRAAAAIPVKYATTGPEAAKYWAGHVARTSYFLANAVAGVTAFNVLKPRGDSGNGASTTNSMGSVMGFANGNEEAAGGDQTSSGGVLNNGGAISATVASRLLLESMMVYEQDWQAVSRGDVKFPWDMEPFSNHRQQQPLYALRQSLRFVREAVGTLERRSRGAEAKGIWLDKKSGEAMGYPDYYQNNFHFQGDGWMSSESANVYETSTETLFLGRQDAMQRQALLPLSEHARDPTAKPLKRILEVACGTGRFGTFVRDNHPSAEMASVDLSPFYLDAARDNHNYWRRMRGGGSSEGDATATATTFVQAPAEGLPFEDGAFDAVVCVYLFHEMPHEARAQAAAEMGRVLAPGGVLAFTDSVQRGDRPPLDDRLGAFSDLNEPHYEDYIRSDIGAYFEDAGLEAGGKWIASTSKTLGFTKPEAVVA